MWMCVCRDVYVYEGGDAGMTVDISMNGEIYKKKQYNNK